MLRWLNLLLQRVENGIPEKIRMSNSYIQDFPFSGIPQQDKSPEALMIPAFTQDF